MNALIAELIGTFLLLLLGNSVCANVLLNKTLGNGSGWIVITFGWAIAVFVAVFVAGSISGAHINPAVTLGLAIAGKFEWKMVPYYMAAQLLGAFLGALTTYLAYKPHFSITDDPNKKLGIFCTIPAIRHPRHNFIAEAIGTFTLVFCVFFLVSGDGLGSLNALPVGLLVLGIGLSLGGTTGYAINPARDLGPRFFHFIAPIMQKRDSDWKYAWIPILGPFTGAFLAALLFIILRDHFSF